MNIEEKEIEWKNGEWKKALDRAMQREQDKRESFYRIKGSDSSSKKQKKLKKKQNLITESWLHSMVVAVEYKIFHVVMKKEFKLFKLNDKYFIIGINRKGIAKKREVKMNTLLRDYRLKEM